MAKTEWRDVIREDKNIQQEFPVGYAPMCCIICGDIIGGVFKDLEFHYSRKHQGAPLQQFPCSYCTKQLGTATKRNQHERRCRDKPETQFPLLPGT